MVKPRASVVMPAFNEADRLHANLLATDDVLRDMGISYEIILVDDGSADRTFDEAARAAAERSTIRVERLDRNHGKGHALKRGSELAKGDVVVFLDADLDLDPRQLGSLFALLERHRADVVIGSKHHPESKLNYPKRRRVISIGYKLLLMILFRLPLEDTQTGLKVFRREVLERVYPRVRSKRFASDVEILAVAHRLGYTIVEAPIVLDFRRLQRWGKIRMRDIVRTGFETFGIFFRMSVFRYYDTQDDSPGSSPSGRRVLRSRKTWESLVTIISSRLARVAGLLFGASLLGNVANYLFQLYAGRALGAEGYGALNALLSLLVISGIGGGILLQVMTRYSSKFIAEGRSMLVGALLRRALRDLSIYGSVFLAGLTVAAPWIQQYFHLDSPAPIVLAGASLVVGVAASACMGVLLGTERFGYYSLFNGAALVRLLAAVLLVGALGAGITGGVAAGLVATVFSLALGLVPLWPLIRHGKGLVLPRDAAILAYMKPVFVATAAFTALNSLDVIFARHYLSSAEAGYYAAASVIGKIALYLPSSIVLVLFPMVSVAETHRGETRMLLGRALALTALGAVSVALGFALLPALALRLLLGAAFVPAAGMLRIYGLAVAPLAFTTLLMNFNLARHEVGFAYWLVPVVVGQIAGIVFFHGSGYQIIGISALATFASLVVTAGSVRTRSIPGIERPVNTPVAGEVQFL